MRQLIAGLLVLWCCGCGNPAAPPAAATAKPLVPTPAAPIAFPELGPPQMLQGVKFHEVTFNRGGVPMTVWAYLPANPTEAKLPCVFVAPAGSYCVNGMALGDGDRDEHFPYVAAGFATVSYSLDGDLPRGAENDDRKLFAAVRAFAAADGGLANLQAAADFALQRLPIDPQRLAVAGHSSAATHALTAARRDPRFRACLAYAPCVDLLQRQGQLLRALEPAIPGATEFFRKNSPQQNLDGPTCPTFVFHARDDDNCPFEDTAKYVAGLRSANPTVRLAEVATGGHHESMVRDGVPQGIRWLQEQWKFGAPPAVGGK